MAFAALSDVGGTPLVMIFAGPFGIDGSDFTGGAAGSGGADGIDGADGTPGTDGTDGAVGINAALNADAAADATALVGVSFLLDSRDICSPLALGGTSTAFFTGSPPMFSPLVAAEAGSNSPIFAGSPSFSFNFFLGWPFPGPGSLKGRLRGLVILPVGGNRGFGMRCLTGRSSSSVSGLSPFACSFARKKFRTRPT